MIIKNLHDLLKWIDSEIDLQSHCSCLTPESRAALASRLVALKEIRHYIIEIISSDDKLTQCKDCKLYGSIFCITYPDFRTLPDPHDYCAWAERREAVK